MKHISIPFVLGLLLVGGCAPPLAHAAVTDEELTAIEETVKKLTTEEVAPAFEFKADLKEGTAGATVMELQKFLIAQGYVIPAGATGYFGAQTRAALILLQSAHNIAPAVGYFGPLTRGVVNTMLAASVAEINEDTEEDETDDSTKDDEDTDDDSNAIEVDSSAVAHTVSGADNDYATFTIEVAIRAFGQDAFFSRNGDTAFTYQIENASTGAVVAGATAQTAVFSSSADTSGNYYRINEDEKETLTATVTFNPLASDEGGSFRLQLLTLEYTNSPSAPDQTLTLAPSSKYETPAVYIND